jgi:hypothetical protein
MSLISVQHDDSFVSRVIITIKDKEEFKKAFLLYPPTNKTTKIGFAGKDDIVVKSPFKLNINNPARPYEGNSFSFHIDYDSDKYDMQIIVPIEMVKDFVERTQRGVTDSEHHYFTGVSMSELHNMRLMAYDFAFKHKLTGKVISWYGGDKTLTDETGIQEIIDFLLS